MEHTTAYNTLWNITHSTSWHPKATQPNASGLIEPRGGHLFQTLGLCTMLLMDILAIVGNLAVMTVIARTPRLRKFVFVFHLCLVDLIAALVLMPLGMLSGQGFFNKALCQGYLCLSVGLISAAILTISAINVERYYYVVHPMRYEVKMTVGLVVSVLIGIWIKAILMSTFPLLSWALDREEPGMALGKVMGKFVEPKCCSLHWMEEGPQQLVFMVLFTLMYFLCPVLIIFVVYCNMFKVARVAAMQQGPVPTWMETPRPRSESLSSRSSMAASLSGARNTPQRTFSGGKAAVVLVAVGGQFLGCWLPYFSFHLYCASHAVLSRIPRTHGPAGGRVHLDRVLLLHLQSFFLRLSESADQGRAGQKPGLCFQVGASRWRRTAAQSRGFYWGELSPVSSGHRLQYAAKEFPKHLHPSTGGGQSSLHWAPQAIYWLPHSWPDNGGDLRVHRAPTHERP